MHTISLSKGKEGWASREPETGRRADDHEDEDGNCTHRTIPSASSTTAEPPQTYRPKPGLVMSAAVGMAIPTNVFGAPRMSISASMTGDADDMQALTSLPL
jgi:hypothetical protein